MSENDPRYAHSKSLSAVTCVLGVVGIVMFAIAMKRAMFNAFLDDNKNNQQEQDEFVKKVHKIAIAGGALVAASLLSAFLGCTPLPNFISKRITPKSPNGNALIESGLSSNRSNQVTTTYTSR